MDRTRYDAIVIGAGPNGLTAAAVLTRAGRSVLVLEANARIGGACSSAPMSGAGSIHDLGSAVHPLAVASPAFHALALERFGLRWCEQPVPLAHPLGDGSAGALLRSLDETVALLGPDGAAYHRLVEPLVEHWDAYLRSVLAPLTRFPRHPLLMARFGAHAVRAASGVAQGFTGPTAAALLAGLAAHGAIPLERAATTGPALILAAAAHVVGWPVPKGGAQSISDALAASITADGGEIVTGQRVTSLGDLPTTRHVLLDIGPRQLVALAGGQLPQRVRRRARAWRQAAGVCKVDYLLDGPVPWTVEICKRAGTIHVGGLLHEIADSEQAAAGGRIHPRPFTIVAQPSLADVSRAPGGRQVLWAYCHVPLGSDSDVSAAMESHLERHAPGWRELIVERHVHRAVDLQEENANLVGGDLSGGALTLRQLLWRQLTARPYRTGIEGVWLCSSSTPPGGGVHGMCGWNAAHAVLSARS